jgi:hypothetical protein
MPITRDFGNGFSVVDWTGEVNTVPNQWGLLGQLGIFREESVSEHVVVFEEIIKDGALIVDRVRGDRSNVGKDAQRKMHSFVIPHFPMEDAIYPQDVQGKRAYGSDGVETLELVRARKLARIRQNHAWTLEVARAQAITQGTVYAPSGTVSQDWYQEMTGAARPAAVDFLLNNSATEIASKIEEVLARIQDSSGELNYSGVIALAGTTFFEKLVRHATIKQAYQYYTSTAEPMRRRLSENGSAVGMRRTFEYMGVTFIEMRDNLAGTTLIPATECYFVPTGTEYFKTYFSPANRFGLVNTLGEQVYVFESMAPNGTAYNFESESNFINALLKPLCVVKAVVGA